MDLAVLIPPVPSAVLGSEALLEVDLVAALPAGHPLARTALVALSSLARERFVIPAASVAVGLLARILEVCGEAGFRPQVVDEQAPGSPLLTAVAAGAGVSLVPPPTARRFTLDRVSYRPLDTRATLGLCAAWRRDDLSEPSGSFLEALRQVVKDPASR